MRRAQFYLDDDLWKTLHARARTEKTTLSELVRRAVRDRYFGGRDQRRNAMRDFIGIRATQDTVIDAVEEVGSLRHGTRMDRLAKCPENTTRFGY